ncbi:MAG: cation-translocating P-type ATPase [Woeseiaceae bacterium]
MNTKSGDSGIATSDAPWSETALKIAADLAVDPALGLDATGVANRRRVYGPNTLRAAKPRRVLAIAADQFRSFVILLLAVAGVLAILFSEHAEGLAIFAVISINGTIGFVTEWRATRSMEALKELGRVDTVVMRDGVVQLHPADQLVPGDIVILDGGDIVTADVRLIEAAKLQADESTLTGESLPVAKDTEPVSPDTPVMERSNMVFKGTAITRGSGKGVIVSIGRETELGRISELVLDAGSQRTPLERRLDKLGERLAGAVAVIAVLIAVAGIVAGRETFLAIEVAIALAVAAIPEGLPIVATIALARGMWRMSKQNALISRLSAVETLGATSIILTDKTGTLTENRMTVTALRLAEGEVTIDPNGLMTSGGPDEEPRRIRADTLTIVDELFVNAALCNNGSLQEKPDGEFNLVGDPTELALLLAASRRGIRREALLKLKPEIREVSFDPQLKLMATLHRHDRDILFAVKGAPESVVPICSTVRTATGNTPLDEREKQRWLDQACEFGERGLRTLAVASKTSSDSNEEPYRDLVLLGITAMEDPAREGVKDAIDQCRDAGISVIMVTGDHLATAQNIADEVGITDINAGLETCINGDALDEVLAHSQKEEILKARVVSRATPKQKLDLIDFYQQQGYIVAMTGDGVNDAPALKKADIGVAMGVRGTAVAKEAAHMVLRDDEFRTIVGAVAQGRAIYDNIRKFVVYLLSCNISEVLIVSLATIAGAPLPLLPLQILFLNLVTDVFPALALGVGEGSPSLMKYKPRPASETLLTRAHWLRIGLHGTVISATVLAAMAIAFFVLNFQTVEAVTVSFCTLAFAQLWHVFNMRDDTRQVFSNEITRNIWIWIAIVTCLMLIFAAIYVPALSDLMRLSNPGVDGWLLILPMSLVPVFTAPLVNRIAFRESGQPGT